MQALFISAGGNALVLGATVSGSVGAASSPDADYTITDQSSFNTFMSSAGAGEIGEITTTDLSLSYSTTQDLGGAKLRTASGITVYQLDLTNITNLDLDGCNFANDNSSDVDPDANEAANAMLILSNCDDCTVQNSTFDGSRGDNDYDKYQHAIFVESGSLNVRVDSCTFTNVFRAWMPNACGDGTLANAARFTNNTVQGFSEQAIRVAWSDAVIDGNRIEGFVGATGIRLNGTITGTISVGDKVSLNDAGAQGGEVFAVGASTVDVRYNVHEKPASSGQYQVRGATGNYITSSTPTKTGYDPVHPDGIQAINNSATRDYILKIRKNFIGRRKNASPYVDFPNITNDNGYPGIRIQKNHGSWGWTSAEISQNIVYCDHTESIEIAGCDNGDIRNNLIVYKSGYTSGGNVVMRLNSDNCDASGNIGDFTGGIIDNGTGNTTTNSVEKGPSDYATDFTSLNIDTDTAQADFTPASDLSGAGPLTTAGAYRTLP